jgi:LmbE family N-acetylglucosaminyl deacetylase
MSDTFPIWTPGPPGRVVVVAPHPDDEVFGAGGLMHDLHLAGWTVVLVAVTEGEGAYGRDGARGRAALARRRRAEQALALACLGLADVEVHRLGLPDGDLQCHETAIARALRALAEGADWLLTTWRHDGHPDHESTGRACAAVAGDLGLRMAEFPVWGAVPPAARGRWSWPLAAATRSAKAAAVDAFASQLGPSPHGPPVVPRELVERCRRADEVLLV